MINDKFVVMLSIKSKSIIGCGVDRYVYMYVYPISSEYDKQLGW